MLRSFEVRLDKLCKHYGKTAAVDDVSLVVDAGEMLALLGPSGCGKTTCLRMIAGLVAPTGGDILVGGRSIIGTAVHRRNVGMLFQNYALFPHMTVAENVAFGLKMRGQLKAEFADKVARALDMVQLKSFGDRLPSQLSGGQQQRVSLARALVIEPDMLLLDEPLGALDKSLRESMQLEIRNLQQRLGLTTIMVTHDQDEALTMADQIAVMQGGKLEQIAPAAEIYRKPVNRFVAGFIGASNFLPARIEQRRQDGSARLVTPAGLQLDATQCAVSGERAVVTVRPEAIALRPLTDGAAVAEINCVAATVTQVVYRGYMLHYTLRLSGGEEMIAWRQAQGESADQIYPVGSAVCLSWSAESNHLIADI
ncbi:ABC transporter ATP-binding protein [Brenneria goodwinii]|uniref:Spermidine/putrescine import ATP-binding protein PotA n=1 Tax=Brenneria goodwinii TaxID=1109412 RepID=A0A0G4JZ60_9GAMM|nr:ABC transporter ATP-binding protein [Brenneria goodwinii]CPR19241.1 Putrescine transport ATP-binding protein PotA (TC 3.A.1.11.1) [Brenneria goodwinii]